MTAREVARELKPRGAKKARQRGSHATYVSEGGACQSTVPMHSGDLPNGTLRAIQRDFEAVFGKGWLLS